MSLEILSNTLRGNLRKEFIIKMKNRQIDTKLTKQVRIDTGLHQLLKIKSAKAGVPIKTLLEGYIAEGLKDETAQNSS